MFLIYLAVTSDNQIWVVMSQANRQTKMNLDKGASCNLQITWQNKRIEAAS